jgi:hypothetical protein
MVWAVPAGTVGWECKEDVGRTQALARRAKKKHRLQHPTATSVTRKSRREGVVDGSQNKNR